MGPPSDSRQPRRDRRNRPAPVWLRLSALLCEPPPPTRTDAERMQALSDHVAQATAAVRGIEAYQKVLWRRPDSKARALWRLGSARLLDFADGEGPTALVIPSLVNGPEILDLMPGRSFMALLAEAGFRPLLLDWGASDAEERRFDADAYILQRLAPAYARAAEEPGGPPTLVGYCMGGTLAVALAATLDAPPRAVACIGAPWDFTRMPAAMSLGGDSHEAIETMRSMEALYGAIPPEVAQASFALDNLASGAARFADFGRMDPKSEAARFFIAIQDWLHEGRPISAPLLRGCLKEWRIENRPVKRLWRLNDRLAHPDEIQAPLRAFIGRKDSVAPPAACLPMAGRRGAAAVRLFETGHVGMIAGNQAREVVAHIRRMALGD